MQNPPKKTASSHMGVERLSHPLRGAPVAKSGIPPHLNPGMTDRQVPAILAGPYAQKPGPSCVAMTTHFGYRASTYDTWMRIDSIGIFSQPHRRRSGGPLLSASGPWSQEGEAKKNPRDDPIESQDKNRKSAKKITAPSCAAGRLTRAFRRTKKGESGVSPRWSMCVCIILHAP